MKFTVIIPVYNEIDWIKKFIESLYAQSLLPDEIIIADGESKDWTLEYLRGEEKKKKLKVFSLKCNPAEARNYAIQHATHDIILCTDAWCVVDKYWCEKIIDMYKKNKKYKVIWGKSDYILQNEFQEKAKNRIISPDKNFHFFSSRNLSFYKEVWEKVGGYPEYLTLSWEDTYFNYTIEQAGYTIHLCKDAIVKWWLRRDYRDFYNMYRNYTQWDMEVYMIHNVVQSSSIKQAAIFVIFWLWFFALPLFMREYTLVVYPVIILLLGVYKQSGWGFFFDLKFSLIKMRWMSVWLLKGIVAWYKIKKRLHKKKII